MAPLGLCCSPCDKRMSAEAACVTPWCVCPKLSAGRYQSQRQMDDYATLDYLYRALPLYGRRGTPNSGTLPTAVLLSRKILGNEVMAPSYCSRARPESRPLPNSVSHTCAPHRCRRRRKPMELQLNKMRQPST
jgi:hypothetical protein